MENKTSKRDMKFETLCGELKYWGMITTETDMDGVKALANELSWREIMRITHKLRRKRGAE